MRRIITITALFACTVSAACDKTKDAAEAEPTRPEPAVTVPASIEIQGHRGARGLRPENTLPAIEAALDHEVDVIEIDLHLTRDDQVVVWHDPYVFLLSCRYDSPRDQPAVRGPVGPPPPKNPLKMSVVDPDRLPMLHPALMLRNQEAAQLRKLKCDRNPKPGEFPEQKPEPGVIAAGDYGIVTLAEVFAFVEKYSTSEKKTAAQRKNAAQVRYNLELKRSLHYETFIADGFDGENAGTFERAVVDVVQKQGLVDRVVFQSFDDRVLWAIRKLQPDATLAALEREDEANPGTREHPDVALSTWAKNGATIWSPDHDLVTEDSLREARKAGLKVIPWTVNETAEMERLSKLGVDGIITDRPDLIAH